MCFSCNKPPSDAFWYEGYRLCYPCYLKWVKADENAQRKDNYGTRNKG